MSEKNEKSGGAQVADQPSVIVDEAALNQLNQTERSGTQPTEAATAPVAEEAGQPAAEDGADAAPEEDLMQDLEIGTGGADADEMEMKMAERERKWKLAGKIIIIAGAVIVSILIAVGIASVVGDSVKSGVTALTGGTESGVTVITPAMNGADGSGCVDKWHLEGNTMVFKDCVTPIFDKE